MSYVEANSMHKRSMSWRTQLILLCKRLKSLDGLIVRYGDVRLAVIFRRIRLTPRKSTKISGFVIGRAHYCARFTEKISGNCGASLYSKFQHSRAQCAWIKTEDICRTVWSFNSPACVLQRPQNVFAFDFLQSLCREGRLFRYFFETIDRMQNAALRMDDRALDRVG